MKKTMLIAAIFSGIAVTANAQLKTKPVCGPFSVDILNGTVDNVRPNFTPEEIKEKFPCFTSEEQDNSQCGSALLFKDRD
ncbi:MAG: hypothetical protein JST13_12985, partial [Bacteroidetes bacterium]|nr:hypothetical protein [Bacteroidota bacterium]